MKKLFLPLLVVCLFSSCATMFNTRDVVFYNSAKKSTQIIIDNDTIDITHSNGLRAAQSFDVVKLKRRDKSNDIIVLKETSVDTIMLEWKNTLMLDYIDLADVTEYAPKYYLERVNYLASDEYKMKYSHKGVLNFRLGLPVFSEFNDHYSGYDRISSIGMGGLSIGFDYFYRDDIFVNFSIFGIMNVATPYMGAHQDFEIYEDMQSIYGAISHNHKIGKIAFGCGLSYGIVLWNTMNYGYWWTYTEPESVNRPNIFRMAQSMGLIFPIHYYNNSNSFYWGVVYRPTFLQVTDKVIFKYQHTISFELGWRIRLAK